jgi:hypothetical protein
MKIRWDFEAGHYSCGGGKPTQALFHVSLSNAADLRGRMAA